MSAAGTSLTASGASTALSSTRHREARFIDHHVKVGLADLAQRGDEEETWVQARAQQAMKLVDVRAVSAGRCPFDRRSVGTNSARASESLRAIKCAGIARCLRHLSRRQDHRPHQGHERVEAPPSRQNPIYSICGQAGTTAETIRLAWPTAKLASFRCRAAVVRPGYVASILKPDLAIGLRPQRATAMQAGWHQQRPGRGPSRSAAGCRQPVAPRLRAIRMRTTRSEPRVSGTR